MLKVYIPRMDIRMKQMLDRTALAAERDGSVYAGGRFTTAGVVRAENVARWDGSSWSRLGSGIGGGDAPSVTSLAVDGYWNLYVGGVFTTAGTKGSSYFAMWHGEPIVGVPVFSEPTVGFALHGGVPNPFTGSTLVSFDLPRTEHVRLEVFDACGRRVRSLFSASRPAGRHSVTWDGVDEGGQAGGRRIPHRRPDPSSPREGSCGP
jgi:hypothetical protein